MYFESLLFDSLGSGASSEGAEKLQVLPGLETARVLPGRSQGKVCMIGLDNLQTKYVRGERKKNNKRVITGLVLDSNKMSSCLITIEQSVVISARKQPDCKRVNSCYWSPGFDSQILIHFFFFPSCRQCSQQLFTANRTYFAATGATTPQTRYIYTNFCFCLSFFFQVLLFL